jgi:PadR family transcriptional regulator PadR
VGANARSEIPELLQGTLDMLILKAVSVGPMHGYGILLRIQHFSRSALEIQQGSLYPAVYRLEHQGLLLSEWGISDNNRRAKFYSLTAAGRRRLREERESWSRLVQAITSVLDATPADLPA